LFSTARLPLVLPENWDKGLTGEQSVKEMESLGTVREAKPDCTEIDKSGAGNGAVSLCCMNSISVRCSVTR